MRTSETIADIAAALAEAQGLMEKAKRSGSNEHFRSRYPTLDDLLEVAKASLSQCGICFVQAAGLEPERMLAHVDTVLMHGSGQWMRSELQFPVEGQSVQNLGGTFTYLKRQALSSMLGISCDVDDDGEADRISKSRARPSGKFDSRPRVSGSRSDAPDPPARADAPPAPPEGIDTMEVSGTLAAVVAKPTANGGTRYSLELDGFSERWASTFDDDIGKFAEANKGSKVLALVKRGPRMKTGSGYLWNVVDLRTVTAGGGEAVPDETEQAIPF